MKKLIALSMIILAASTPLWVMERAQAQEQQAVSGEIAATGVVKSVTGKQWIIAHDPIPALGWSAMEMPFAIAPEIKSDGLPPGSKIRFVLKKSATGEYLISNVQPAR